MKTSSLSPGRIASPLPRGLGVRLGPISVMSRRRRAWLTDIWWRAGHIAGAHGRPLDY